MNSDYWGKYLCPSDVFSSELRAQSDLRSLAETETVGYYQQMVGGHPAGGKICSLRPTAEWPPTACQKEPSVSNSRLCSAFRARVAIEREGGRLLAADWATFVTVPKE